MPDSSKPVVCMVPGLWYGNSNAWAAVTKRLQAKGYPTINAHLSAEGCPSEFCPELDDDIALVRQYIAPVVRKGGEVVMVLHSAAGFIGGAAIEGLTRKERKAQGKPGGVICIAFIAGCLLSEDAVWSFLDVNDAITTCKNPRMLMFNDLSDEEVKPWLEALEPFPSPHLYQTNPDLPHEGFLDTKCFYMITKNDLIFPEPLQEIFAESANAEVVKVEAGHMVHLTQPDKVLAYIEDCIRKTRKLER